MYRVACVNKEQSNTTRRARGSDNRREDCNGKASSHGGQAGCGGRQKGRAHWEAMTRPFFAIRLIIGSPEIRSKKEEDKPSQKTADDGLRNV